MISCPEHFLPAPSSSSRASSNKTVRRPCACTMQPGCGVACVPVS